MFLLDVGEILSAQYQVIYKFFVTLPSEGL